MVSDCATYESEQQDSERRNWNQCQENLISIHQPDIKYLVVQVKK